MPARWTAGTWKIDPAHTTAGFCDAAPDEPGPRNLQRDQRQIVTDLDPYQSTATATIALSSVSTGNDERDAHLLPKEAT